MKKSPLPELLSNPLPEPLSNPLPEPLSKSILNKREYECLQWASQGKSTEQTAQLLFLSSHTIKYHMRNAIKKLAAANKTEAVAISIRKHYL